MSVWGVFSFGWGLVCLCALASLIICPAVGLIHTQWVVFDTLSIFLTFLVVVLGLASIFFNGTTLTKDTRWYLFLSLGFSVMCFCVNHSILFWCFYELSMLPLLFLIFRDSPYSERFLAGWYFSGYLLITSLPLLLVLFYLSFVNNCMTISLWGYERSLGGVYCLLAFIFFTKVPLCPFHTWLPIVHAEATSIVSTFLSGYIMKLGLVGVIRFCGMLFSDDFGYYLELCCVLGVCFLVSAAGELDGKRWLALLSLSHIVIPFIGLFFCGWSADSLIFLYSLGHGLGAGLVFGLLWQLYDATHTRNWVLLKSGVSGCFSLVLVSVGLLSLCSFPPTLQFFSEVYLLIASSGSSVLLTFWVFYLFLGGVVPLVLCGNLMLRVEAHESDDLLTLKFGAYLLIYAIWCFLGILVF